MNAHTVTLPDGRTETVNSKRDYTHAVAVFFWQDNNWDVVSWHGDDAKAAKAGQAYINTAVRGAKIARKAGDADAVVVATQFRVLEVQS